MHKKLLILFLFLFVVGCKKAEDPNVDRNASALEGGGDGVHATTDEGEHADDADATAPTENAERAEAADEEVAAEEDEAANRADDVDDAKTAENADGVAKRQFRGKHEITVISTGDAPRQLLRYDFQAMKPSNLEARTEVDTQIEGQTLVVPRVVQAMKIEKVEVLGDVVRVTVQSEKPKYEARMKNDPVHDMIIESMEQMAEMGAIRFSFEMDHFGNTGNAKILSSSAAVEEEVQAMIANQIDQFTNGFPSEPVGKGAQWSTKTELDMGGEFKVDATVHYQVKSIDKKGATIALHHEVSDLRHAMNLEGAENAIMSGKLEGSGTMKVRFDQVMPTLDQTVFLDMKVSDESKEMAMKLKVGMTIRATD